MLTKLNSTYLEALPKQIDLHTKKTAYPLIIKQSLLQVACHLVTQIYKISLFVVSKVQEFVRLLLPAKVMLLLQRIIRKIELRLMAHISKDQNLLSAFNEDKDVHSVTASTMFNVPFDAVTKEYRRKAKAINFGLIYGMSAFGLAKQINVSRTEAKQYIDAYFAKLPKCA